ncbi:hypothetical protein K493DRAFT_316706 [Basidiobolus meristosporus CBS 931.73]|uniref:Uncharacterized protein n=1 Tax=Basidiobolus meristosporus CBS 931.73 TaxID=1314790 RepID=A0A1Y1Y2T6_9FUNG|nr:hypothetical protein K493DRAFT_316706 [Basidiobolus meristosporus CBS 931.73]|eukprot:ORX92195.1 hypothetical protein K493DRAFT_316706 [Basidiobolus meristosporus CBS 931.73]
MASQILRPQHSSTFGYSHHHSQSEHKPSELVVFNCERSSDSVIIRRGDDVQYHLKRQLFGKRYVLNAEHTKNTLIRAVTHKAVGYITLKSEIFSIHFNLSFPQFPRGVYTFEIDGVSYLWDYEMNSHLRCFTVKDMKLVAQFFSNSFNAHRSHSSNISQEEPPKSNKWNARLAMVKDITPSSGTLALITMTGLLLMKKQIW